jgi:hypothetical protein
VPARRETLAHRPMTPIFIPLWFGWALETGHRGGHFALFHGDCRNQPDSLAEQAGFEPATPGSVMFGKLSANLAQYLAEDNSGNAGENLIARNSLLISEPPCAFSSCFGNPDLWPPCR